MSGEGLEKRMNSPEELLGSSFPCECGKEHVVPVRRMVVEEEAYRRLPEVLEELSLPREACVVADQNTFEVLGGKVVRLLSGRKYAVQEKILRSPPGKTVKADQPTADALLASLPSVPLLIAVGSGTINDLTKLAAYRRGIPYVVLATAPSMNGYTSSIVALTVSGLKTTSEANPPVAVIADMKVLVGAPMELIVSGLGDLVSKPVCTADWKLAEMIGGEYFCYRPIQIVEAFEPGYMNHPDGIRLRQPGAIRALTKGLLYSGISMVVAGSSSPGSGGEHLISHTLDMQADLAGREHGYHGSQVGVATIFSAALYERLLQQDISSFDIEALLSHEEELVRRRFSLLRQYWGPFAEVVAEEFSFKRRGARSMRERLTPIREKWDEIKKELAPFLRPWAEIRDVLRKAEAPARIGDIGVSVEQFRAAVLHAREMRRRYTVLDLADDFGLLQQHLDSIISETGLGAE